MNKPYTPRADSLPSQVIGYFTNNPKSALLLEEITDLFDCVRGNIHTILRPAVEAGMLARKQNDDGDYVYYLPPNFVKSKFSKTARKSDDSDLEARFRKPSDIDSVRFPDPVNVVIEDDVPLPAGRGAFKQDWTPLLKKLQPKQSFKLPMAAQYILAANVTACHKAGPARFITRRFKDKQELRVWRIS